MALATKCPHCNTVFRVAHDQLKLRGGIVRCGSCNEVFDGNAALLEPPSALPPSIPLDQKMAALDTRAAAVLGAEPAPPTLELDVADDAAAPEPAPAIAAEPEPRSAPAPAIAAEAPQAQAGPAPDTDMDDEPIATAAPAPIPLPAEPAILPASTDALFDLDLDIESEPDLEASSEPDVSPTPLEDVLNAESMSEDELEAALEAELSAMEQTLGDVQHDADGQPIAEDAYADMSGGRVEPTWGEPPLDDEPQAGAGPGLDTALAAAADAVFAAEAEDAASTGDAEAVPAAAAPPARPPRDDELDEIDEEALAHLSGNGLAEAQAARGHAYLHKHSMDDELAPANEEQAAPEEPGFVKRDRQRQKFGKAATILMSLGSVLLVAALLAQAVTTFRNAIAANVPALKPALTAACRTLGCKIELPTQIDDLTIEQGELQTLSDTTFSFTTLLRNQSATAQAWPSIELVLDDANDKRILRRVFTPRDYLGADVAIDKGFAPHSEQAVKLYFELHDLKASGYHIAVFYP
ncbi:DUF3426 domain-containing protein [Duganella sp. SG902]|uniref:DUF3426 domain-containing protein n=1 Tax=Duganella sp. SG902 TaxID=2587016 RepID=UPI00159DDCCD|nr:DUF3426 domain-containing protein [Duganella sp. SG902]